MAEIFIDNKQYELNGNKRVLQFILDQGLELPFFCYHPSLSAPANCRQCYVEAGTPVFNRDKNAYDVDDKGERIIRWFPKLQTSCNLDATDGMVIKTHKTSDLVKRGQKDVLEFILINHPLDCPICDQAGECPLQVQTYKYGPEGSRFEHKKVHKPKRVQLGPRVVLDAERCINCTRCVRFTDEISKSNQLTIISRGDKNYPMTAPDMPFDDAYSMNTVDICPVGALTAADFRFKARVWEMNSTPGIDITNGKGCSVDIWTRDNLIMRITPRFNPFVNDYWMPDKGRDAYRLYNENRISKPEIKAGSEHIKTSWNNAVMTFAEQLGALKSGQIAVIGSPHACMEDNYVLQKFFSLLGKASTVFTPHIEAGSGDGFLLSDDQAPNTNGCRLIGVEESDPDAIEKLITDKNIKALIILSEDLVGRGIIKKSELKGKFIVSLATNYNETTAVSDLIVPVTTAVEHTGSYLNIDGRIQRSIPAKETAYISRRQNLEMSMGRLDHFGTQFDNWVTDKNKIDCIPAWEFLTLVANHINLNISYTSSRDILAEINSADHAFKDVTYERMDNEMGIDLKSALKKELKNA